MVFLVLAGDTPLVFTNVVFLIFILVELKYKWCGINGVLR